MLQAPYESNEFWQTIWATARWVGSPVAALSYTLWNIKITGKCAMMVDMATPYGQVPKQDSPFGQMRDSLYILSVMNQCRYLSRLDQTGPRLKQSCRRHKAENARDSGREAAQNSLVQ